MSYKSKIQWLADNAARYIAGVKKWNPVEDQNHRANMADSVAWEHQKYTMTSNTYDCTANGNLQERTLSSNGTLTVTNPEAGKYYTLIKKGAFTLTLPTGHYSSSGAATGTGTTVITFFYDGSNLFFSFTTYSAT